SSVTKPSSSARRFSSDSWENVRISASQSASMIDPLDNLHPSGARIAEVNEASPEAAAYIGRHDVDPLVRAHGQRRLDVPRAALPPAPANRVEDVGTSEHFRS